MSCERIEVRSGENVRCFVDDESLKEVQQHRPQLTDIRSIKSTIDIRKE
jgi:hypothetical protein